MIAVDWDGLSTNRDYQFSYIYPFVCGSHVSILELRLKTYIVRSLI